MARLPARPTAQGDRLSPARAYVALEDTCGQLRHQLRIFKQQTAAGTVPHSHVVDRLIAPMMEAHAALTELAPAIGAPVQAYVRVASGEATQSPREEVSALISTITQAVADIKAAAPRLFTDGDYRPRYRVDERGRVVSADMLSPQEVAALTVAVDRVLALIVE